MSTVSRGRNLALDERYTGLHVYSSFKFFICLKCFTITNWGKLKNKNTKIEIPCRPNKTHLHGLVPIAGHHLQSLLPINCAWMWQLLQLLNEHLYSSPNITGKAHARSWNCCLSPFSVLISPKGSRRCAQDSEPGNWHPQTQAHWSPGAVRVWRGSSTCW